MQFRERQASDDRDYKIFRVFIISQVILLFCGLLFALILKSIGNTISLICFLFSLALVIILGIVFYLQYKNLPIVREKRIIVNRQKRIKNEINGSRRSLENCASLRKKISNEEDYQTFTRNQLHQTKNFSVSQRNQLTQNEESSKIANELDQIQKQFIFNGLRTTLIRDAKIPGFGPASKEKLINSGIISAFDVTFLRVEAISGFGQSKAQFMLDWKNSILSSLNIIKPQALPYEIENPIREFYKVQYRQLEDELDIEKKNLLIDLQQISDNALQKHNQNNVDEKQHANSLFVLSEKLVSIENQLLPYSGIRFSIYLKEILQKVIPSAKLSPKTSLIAATGILGFILLSQLSLGVAATSSAVASLIPTSTSTPTLTPTSTSTLTPTVTCTPTITTTPTNTKTPTITLTPTLTLPAALGASCVPSDHERVLAQVVKVTDGDTIVVNIEGKEYRVRYIGTDSPESNQLGGLQATSHNKFLVEGKTVILVKDVSETDSFGRLLRYVFVDGIFVNYEMTQSGYAISGSWPPDTSCDKTLSDAYQSAKTYRRGLWIATPAPVTSNSGIIQISPIPTSQSGSICNCSIDYNCSDFSTHSQAQACYVSCGSNNWSGLDRDLDGLACESLP